MNQEANLAKALAHARIDKSNTSFLGEGAWHYAWKVSAKNGDFVLRIPKPVAYGEAVAYDKQESMQEYTGTELYYQNVNRAVQGAAPEFFCFHVSEEVTYTLESFAGNSVNFRALAPEKAFEIGQQVGSIYRKTEEIPHGLEGCGYLSWSEEGGLMGSLKENPLELLVEESQEFLSDCDLLSQAIPEFAGGTIKAALEEAAQIREQAFTEVCLTNQDASPENILLDGGRVRLIDPFPIVYYPRGMAGNFMNLYETLFALLSDTERYKKHQFAAYTDQLHTVAQGFLAGYSGGDKEIQRQVRAEQLLQLHETVFTHHQMLEEELSKARKIRFGNKEDIRRRLGLLVTELKEFSKLFLEDSPFKYVKTAPHPTISHD
ncbi:hypothetical protein [Planococcus sp. YIM B11945]|uniref:hypothetical protein n=1 Tax=Planococcus sp. YIM B11945 TaxID=3435410 RepID=UPI003D7E4722